MSIETLTENPVSAEQPSAHPYDLLPLRQFFILMARAYGREMVDVARVLKISRDTLYQDIRRSEDTLRLHLHVRRVCAQCGREPRLLGRQVGERCASLPEGASR